MHLVVVGLEIPVKFKLAALGKFEIIRQAEVHRMNVEFENLTDEDVSLAGEYFTPSCYQYNISNGLIAGNRSCFVEDQLFLDTPPEWTYEELLSYVARVKKVHKREFAFVSDYSEETGEGELELPRPYLHLDESVFFCGCVEYWNFGFFLTVLMQKVFIATTIDKRPILVPICSSWQVTLLQSFFPETRFIFYDPAQVVSVAKATVIGWPGFGFHIGKDYLDYLRSAADAFEMDNGADRKRICFARQSGMYAKRLEMLKLLSVDSLKNGFTPLYPELVAPKRLAKMVRSSESILLDSGSALFNLVFSRSGLNAVLFESRKEFLLNHSRFLNSLAINAKVIFVDNKTDVKKLGWTVFMNGAG